MTYIKRKSLKQERRTAKDLGGKTQIASGAIDGMKADVRTGSTSTGFNESDYLIENKFTDSEFYKLDVKTWEKVKQEAFRDNMRIPLMQIDIGNYVSLIVMSHDDFKGMELDQEWLDVHEGEIVKGNSTRLKGHTYELLQDNYVYLRRDIHFMKQGIHLVTLNYQDFKNFTT